MAIASQHGTLQLRGRILTVRSLPYKDAELYYSKRTQVFSLEGAHDLYPPLLLFIYLASVYI